MNAHWNSEQLALWLTGDSEPADSDSIEEHLAHCAVCADRLEETAVTMSRYEAFQAGTKAGLRECERQPWFRAAAAAVLFLAGMATQAVLSPTSGVVPETGDSATRRAAETPRPVGTRELDVATTRHDSGLARSLAALRVLSGK